MSHVDLELEELLKDIATPKTPGSGPAESQNESYADPELEQLLKDVEAIPESTPEENVHADPKLEALLKEIAEMPPRKNIPAIPPGTTVYTDPELDALLKEIAEMPTKSKIKPPPTSVQQGDSAASKQMTEEEKPTNNDLDSKEERAPKANISSATPATAGQHGETVPSKMNAQEEDPDPEGKDTSKETADILLKNEAPTSGDKGESIPSKKKVEEKKSTKVDPDGKLQRYYDIIAEKVSVEIAQTVVWEGAAKRKKIKMGLDDMVEDDCELDEDEAALIAKLFSSQLSTEKKVKEHFLPTMKTIATCQLEHFRDVAIYMLVMLLHKMSKKGLSLATKTLPRKTYYRVLGDAVTKDCEILVWPKFMVKMPKPDKILSPEEFKEILTQDIAGLGKEGKVSWILLLGYSPESIHGEIVRELKDLPWADLLKEVSSLIENRSYYDQAVVKRASVRVVKTWGDATNLEQRKAAVKQMKENIDHKEFEKVLEQIMKAATFPLEDLQGNKDNPCLLVTSPTTQLAVKLFKHTVQSLGKIDSEKTIRSLCKQRIADEPMAAVIREMSRMKLIDDEIADDVLYSCSSEGLLQSCAELLKVAPNPFTHPFMDILEERDEKTCYKALELLAPDVYAPNCNPEISSALHIAGTYGYTSVCKEILARGFHRLLDKHGRCPLTINESRCSEMKPASMAAQMTHFATAMELLQAMEPEEARQLFTVTSDNKTPEIDLHKLMEEVSKGRGPRWDEKVAREEADFKPVPRLLEKKEKEARVEFIRTALNTTLEGRHVDLTALIQDASGCISEQFSGGEEKKEPDPEKGKKRAGKTLYQKIARSDCEGLKSHECFATLTNIIWIDYGVVQGMLFSLYLLFMAFLTTSLVLAARSDDPSHYNDPLDGFRLFSEVVTLLWVLFDLGLEFYELGGVVYRSLKHHSVHFGHVTPPGTDGGSGRGSKAGSNHSGDSDVGSNKDDDEVDDDDEEDETEDNTPQSDEENTYRSIGVAKDILFEYFLDWQNILDDLAILFVLLILPFRISDSDNQWIFAALAFMFHGLRIFKYAIMFKSVGEYVAILVLLIKRDVPQFVTVFLVIIFSLGGALYLALIGHYNDSNIDTENNNDTSEVYLLWWTGIRILAEGSVLTYYGPGGFNWLGILIYWLFLFIVVVVLLNILIAQFSKSYEQETERAQINVILTRTEIILKMEQSILTRACVRFVRRMRAKLTKITLEYQTVERLTFAGEREEDRPATSEQVEELQTQTTNLGLQLRKQIDDNTGKSTLKVDEMKSEIAAMVKDTREALQNMKAEIEGKFVGLERATTDTRRYVDEIKELLLALKERK